jgi:hypothetical protein
VLAAGCSLLAILHIALRDWRKARDKELLARLEQFGPRPLWNVNGRLISLSLSVQGTPTDRQLETVKHFEHLQVLDLVGAEISDSGFKHLECLNDLNALYVSCKNATDGGLESLAKLDRLETLRLLNGRTMTGTGLRALPAPEKLRKLSILYINDAGMRTVARFSNLQMLWIGGQIDVGQCVLSPDSVKFLHGMESLEDLAICSCSLGDESGPYLTGLSRLRSLHLSNTSMTKASLPHVLRLQNLESLALPFEIEMSPKLRSEISQALRHLRYLKTPGGEFAMHATEEGR